MPGPAPASPLEPRRRRTSLVLRLLRRAFQRALGQQAPVSVLAVAVQQAFYPAMHFVAPGGADWVATLDALHPDDQQVIAHVRLSLVPRSDPARSPQAVAPTPITPLRYERSGARNLSAASDPDPRFEYTFPAYLPVEDNLALFREYVENQLPLLAEGERLPRTARNVAPASATR